MHFWTGPAYAAPPAPPAPLTEEEADHIVRRLGVANLVEHDQHDATGHRYTLINGHVLTIAPNGALAFADAEGAPVESYLVTLSQFEVGPRDIICTFAGRIVERITRG